VIKKPTPTVKTIPPIINPTVRLKAPPESEKGKNNVKIAPKMCNKGSSFLRIKSFICITSICSIMHKGIHYLFPPFFLKNGKIKEENKKGRMNMTHAVKVIGYNEMDHYNVQIINTTSRSETWSKEFSPFTLGPVNLYGNHTAKNIENAWQFSKVYKEHVDQNQDPTSDYYKWAKKGWNDTYGHRYPMGKGKIPLYSYWDGEKLDYIEARKRIYAPLYAKAVIKTDAFNRLLTMHQKGMAFALLDFDGYDYLSRGMTLKEVINEPKKKMGHAFVLAMLLQYPELRKRLGHSK